MLLIVLIVPCNLDTVMLQMVPRDGICGIPTERHALKHAVVSQPLSPHALLLRLHGSPWPVSKNVCHHPTG